MVVHCVGIPAAPLAGVDHVLRNIDIQRDDGGIVAACAISASYSGLEYWPPFMPAPVMNISRKVLGS